MPDILEPAIAVKITKMKERVRWRHPLIRERGIDQTRLVIDDGQVDKPTFSFLVIGDSGSGLHPDHHPQRRIAEHMLPHHQDCRFLLHTGDVIYQIGSSEQYPDNFIKPYREWLLGGEQPERIAYDRMVFKRPFLPVLGNHDYYDLPRVYGLLFQATRPLRRLFGLRLALNMGWHGSDQGDAYARAFLDYLKAVEAPAQLSQHLDRHYPATTETGRCLHYQPGQFTRLPNRYYTFRYGGIDFFALDSSTFNAPSPLPAGPDGERYRQMLAAHRKAMEQQERQLFEEAAQLQPDAPADVERIDDLKAKLEQIAEIKRDIDKQLTANSVLAVDVEQLDWLRQRLIESWNTPGVRGRVIYFHHPPYVSEVTKWRQGQTLAVRHHLRWVLNRAAEAVVDLTGARPLVDLVLSGHAHCFEYLRTVDTGHADAHLNWIICGGSGFSLRRQRPEGPELTEVFPATEKSEMSQTRLVAKSQLFVGLTGHKTERRRPYSFLRIDVQAGRPPKFVIRPFISERYHQLWNDYALDPLVI